MLRLTSSRLAPLALLAVIGVACAPRTRDFGNTGGQGGQGGGSAEGGGNSVSSGPCVAVGVESCFNGLDDDCNGLTDCADPACAGVTVCAPSEPGAESGVLIGETEACPDGFTEAEQVIHRKLVDDGCTGCSCTAATPTCTGLVWYYSTASACSVDTTQIAGTSAGSVTTTCGANPVSGGTIYGARASAWTIKESCTAMGTSAPAPASWGETKKFCQGKTQGKGCSAGSACVPKTTSVTPCTIAKGSGSCTGAGVTQSEWYSGFDDTRTCTGCNCKVSGGSCDPLQLSVGSDYSCGLTTLIDESSKLCFGSSGIYAPPVQLVGKPKVGSCSTTSLTAGSLEPTGPLTLCCQP